MKKNMRTIFILLIITVVFGTMYAVGHQMLRLSANDPQIQIAQDTANLLNTGANPQTIVGGRIYIDKSLESFTQIYDSKGKLILGNAYTGEANNQPEVPIGVLTSADNIPHNDITWQPSDNLRIASVSVKAKDYYVLSGRNISEEEQRIKKIFEISLVGWVASCSMALIAIFFPLFISKRKN